MIRTDLNVNNIHYSHAARCFGLRLFISPKNLGFLRIEPDQSRFRLTIPSVLGEFCSFIKKNGFFVRYHLGHLSFNIGLRNFLHRGRSIWNTFFELCFFNTLIMPIYQLKTKICQSFEVSFVQAHLILELRPCDVVVHLSNLLFTKCLLNTRNTHALVNKVILSVPHCWLNVRIVEIGVQVDKLHRHGPNCIFQPKFIVILLLIASLELFDDARNLLTLLG